MAEEQSLLELNADDKAVKTARPVNRLLSFTVAFIILKVSMLDEHQKLMQQWCSALDMDMQRGGFCPTQPWRDSPVLTYTGSSWIQLMHEPFCSGLGWEAQQTGNV